MTSADLNRFRKTLERLQDRLQQASRPDRLKPPANLTLARLWLGENQAAPPIVGEILDLSPDGMKIAIDVSHEVQVGQPCSLVVGAGEAESFELFGLVRWVDKNPYITVFGIALNDAMVHQRPEA